eukprot:jgi/Mesvir1/5624/Mv15642-RA.1
MEKDKAGLPSLRASNQQVGYVSITDVLFYGLEVNRVDDLMAQFPELFSRCKSMNLEHNGTKLTLPMTDGFTAVLILRALTWAANATARIDCAKEIISLMGLDPQIVNAVFEVDACGYPDEGKYSDLLVTPTPDGLMTFDKFEASSQSQMHLLTNAHLARKVTRDAGLSNEDWKKFQETVKAFAGIDKEGRVQSTCSQGWSFVNVCYMAMINSINMFSQKVHAASTIMAVVLHAFDRVKSHNMHAYPENRPWDVEWCTMVDDRAHYIVTGMDKPTYRALQKNLCSDEPVRYAYDTSTAELHRHVKGVLYAAYDHNIRRGDVAAAEAMEQVTNDWIVIACRFGPRIFSKRVRSRVQIENKKRVEEGERIRQLYWRGKTVVSRRQEGSGESESE